MMLRTGSNSGPRLAVIGYRRKPQTEDRKPNNGFTLIEVMAATLVLVAGIVFIYESFFISLDAFGYCSDYLNIASWVGEKIWQIQDDINRYGFLARIDKRGKFARNNRNFYWSISCNLVNETPDLDLYKIDLDLSWQAGSKKLKLSRTAYATYKYEEKKTE